MIAATTNRTQFCQLELAQLMAKAHGHSWGCLDLDKMLGTCPAEGISEEDIIEAMEAQGLVPDFMPGLITPDINEDGNPCHTTQSGRTTWEVTAPFVVTFEWSRPSGVYATGYVWWDHGIEALRVHVESAPDYRGPTFARHMEVVVEDLFGAWNCLRELDGNVPAPDRDVVWDKGIKCLDSRRVDEVGYLIKEAERLQGEADRLLHELLPTAE